MGFQEKFEQNKVVDAIFTKNMQFFELLSPDVYAEFKSYEPQNLTLAFDESEHINIINRKTGRFVYPERPEQYADKQVDKFLRDTKASVIRFYNPHVVDTQYLHHEMMDSLVELRGDASMPEFFAQDEQLIQQLFIVGIGSGLHIKALLEQKDLNNVVIIENNKDSFYLSMYFVDWESIFRAVKGQLKIIIGDTEKEILDNLHQYTYEVGNYVFTKMFVYRHYVNSTLDTLLENFFKKLLAPSAAAGFYDDEKVGLAHTVENCQRNIPPSTVGLLQRKIHCQLPAVVIGNGPSLDGSEHFLRANKDKMILISCGSSLSALEGMGIKPDIHVEQERPYDTYRWLIKSTTESFRQGIYFYGLNTVHPDCFSLFDADKTGQCLKPNDLGSIYLSRSIKKGHTLSFADGSNPTVTNFGLSLCVLLGMKNVFLAGVDLGMKEIDKHHSEKSYYAKAKDESPNIFKFIEATDDKFKIKGRDGKELYTNAAFNSSKLNIERLIDKYGLNVKNLSDGAEIRGAAFENNDYIVKEVAGKDKIKTLQALHEMVFSSEGVLPESKDKVKSKVIIEAEGLFSQLREILKLTVENEEQLVNRLSEIRNSFWQTKLDGYTAMLFKGSIETMLSAVYSVVLYGGAENYSENFAKSCQIVNRFLEQVEEDMKHNLYNLDTYCNL